MFGLARAAQTASWWGGDAPAKAITTVSITTADPDLFMVAPRYYADLSAMDTSGFPSIGFVPVTNTGQQFDQTGMGTNERMSVQAVTLRMGSSFMTAAPANTYTQGVNDYHIFEQTGGTNWPRNLTLGATNEFAGDRNWNFGSENVSVVLTDSQMDQIRNTWVTVILAASDTSTDFANWTGGTDNTGLGWAARAMLVNTATNTVIGQRDNWFNAPWALGLDLTQQYTVGYNSSNYFVNSFQYTNDWNLYNRKDVNFASGWFAIGSMFDPGDAALRSQVMGSAMSAAVNGVQPFVWYMGTAGGVSTGFLQSPIPPGSRAGSITWGATTGIEFVNTN